MILNKYKNSTELLENYDINDIENLLKYYSKKTYEELNEEFKLIDSTWEEADKYTDSFVNGNEEDFKYYSKLKSRRFIYTKILSVIGMNKLFVREDLRNKKNNRYYKGVKLLDNHIKETIETFNKINQ